MGTPPQATAPGYFADGGVDSIRQALLDRHVRKHGLPLGQAAMPFGQLLLALLIPTQPGHLDQHDGSPLLCTLLQKGGQARTGKTASELRQP
jgi:hypothetical protein